MLTCLLLVPIAACSRQPVSDIMEQYLWQNRVLLIFTPGEETSAYITQKSLLAGHEDGLKDREMVIWELVRGERVVVGGATQPHLATPAFYKAYDVNALDYAVILLGKDGTEKLRRATPVSSTDLFALIDAMPMRQKEMKTQERMGN